MFLLCRYFTMYPYVFLFCVLLQTVGKNTTNKYIYPRQPSDHLKTYISSKLIRPMSEALVKGRFPNTLFIKLLHSFSSLPAALFIREIV